jgi:anti-sigma regulatory factor (Ser/Thr protein kinase)
MIHKKTMELENDLTRRKNDLQKAIYIQRNLMYKKIPLNRKYLIRSMYVPSSTIGGDYHAIFSKNGQIAGIIADVSGHGIEAALYQTLLFMAVEKHQPVIFENTGLFMTLLDQEMGKFNLEYNFATALCFRLDCTENKVYYSNAGHNLPYYALTGKKEKTPFFMENGGPPIGIGMGFEYGESVIPFEKNKFRLIFYTDGLVEDFMDKNKVMSEANLEKILYADNWLEQLNEYKDYLLSLEEHEDIDDTTIIFLEKKSPLRFKIQFSRMQEADIIWHKISEMLDHYDFAIKEKNKVFIILQELITNAVKYSGGGEISVRINAAWTLIRLEDNGTGFDIQEALQATFQDKTEKFFKEKYLKYQSENSLGMGLLMVKQSCDKFYHSERGNIFLCAVKKSFSYTDYHSKHQNE